MIRHSVVCAQNGTVFVNTPKESKREGSNRRRKESKLL